MYVVGVFVIVVGSTFVALGAAQVIADMVLSFHLLAIGQRLMAGLQILSY